MDTTMEALRESAAYIKERLGSMEPEVLIILGSGLGKLSELAEEPVYIPYGDVPHFVRSTAIGHAGRFVAGRLSGKNVLMMQGRFHMYEGWTAEQVVYPVRTAKVMGINKMIITNAAGAVNLGFHAGELMIIEDIIKLAWETPLTGQNLDELGPRFPDMTHIFDREYMELFADIGAKRGESIRRGMYFYCHGPQYETPAEIRAIRTLGADAVGMSTAPECIAANHMGMRILGVTLLANMAAGVLDKPLTGEEVITAANAASDRFSGLMAEFVGRMS